MQRDAAVDMHQSSKIVVAALLLAPVLAAGCGSTDGEGATAAAGAPAPTTTEANGTFAGASSTDGGGPGADAGAASCSAPVDMFIMFDRSGSMGSDCKLGDDTDSKWCRAITAVSGYFKSAGATGHAAALQFFPRAGHSKDLCATGEGYHLAEMPTAATGYETLPTKAFDALLDSTSPGAGGNNAGGTPTEAAVRGITRFTSEHRRGGRVTIGILVTDGNPNGCDESLAALSGILEAHHAKTQIRTYVIGMEGASFDNLEAIAKGGNAPTHPDSVPGVADACGDGAGPCRHWNVGNGDPAVFTAALAAIQESADGCKPGGGAVNPVN